MRLSKIGNDWEEKLTQHQTYTKVDLSGLQAAIFAEKHLLLLKFCESHVEIHSAASSDTPT